MQQKVVIKLPINGKNSRGKALTIAVGVPGVVSAALAGENKNHLEVTGEGIDSAALTELLRKNVGFCELVSVGLVPNDGEDENENAAAAVLIPWHYPYPYGQDHMYVVRDQNQGSCSIM